MAIRFIRWILLHVFFAAFPIVASWAIYHFFQKPPRHWDLGANEVLFFAFMVSSIACGELVELIIRDRSNIFRGTLFVILLLGACWSALLYAFNLYKDVAKIEFVGSVQLMQHSVALAVSFFLLGTLVQVIFLTTGSMRWNQRY